MGRKWLPWMCLLLALTGCGAGKTDPQTYWTEEQGDYRLSLRDNGTEGALDVVLLSGGEETVLRTLTGTRGEDVSADPFTDIMGWDGFRLTERQGLAVEDPEEDWSIRTYYAVEDGASREIAESFGWGAPQDYSVDLDGTGEKELVSNVTYGGDGRRSVYIYQRRGDEVWRGVVNMKGLPDQDDRGAASAGVSYDPARDVFQIRYALKGRGNYGLLETTGLERVEFTPYAPEAGESG
ncbi:MAG: hypothetical protein Q4C45_08820 [Oscillospiraceae bacterium]|nr:hypothetical protein [Oscillospiraceae bacterium]